MRSGLEEFDAPPGLKEILRWTFYECKNLKKVVLNEGLETLGDYNCRYNMLFWNSSIEEITLPSTLKEINGCVF